MNRCVGEGVAQLVAHPLSSWTRGDVEGQNPPPSMVDHEPDVEEFEAKSWNHEEVHSRDPILVIPQERHPSVMLTRIRLGCRQIAGDCREAHADAELRQLSLDSPRAPAVLRSPVE